MFALMFQFICQWFEDKTFLDFVSQIVLIFPMKEIVFFGTTKELRPVINKTGTGSIAIKSGWLVFSFHLNYVMRFPAYSSLF